MIDLIRLAVAVGIALAAVAFAVLMASAYAVRLVIDEFDRLGGGPRA